MCEFFVTTYQSDGQAICQERRNKNESGFRPLLCTYRLNWARRTSWGWWDDWDDTVLQTQDSKFEPWRSEAEHATSRSRRLPTILTSTRGWGRNIFVSLKSPRPGTEPRALAWKAAVLTTTLGPPPKSAEGRNDGRLGRPLMSTSMVTRISGKQRASPSADPDWTPPPSPTPWLPQIEQCISVAKLGHPLCARSRQIYCVYGLHVRNCSCGPYTFWTLRGYTLGWYT